MKKLTTALLIAMLAIPAFGDPPPTEIKVQSPSFTLTWTDNSTNETGFAIERSADGTTFSQIGYVDANVTTYKDANLPFATHYWYRLRAYNSAGFSGYSNVADGTTPSQILPPNAPTALNGTIVLEDVPATP